MKNTVFKIIFLHPIVLLFIICESDYLYSQTSKNEQVFNKFISSSKNSSELLSKRIVRTNKRYLKKYFRSENKLHRKLCKLNPELADNIFSLKRDPLYYHQNDPNCLTAIKNNSGSKEYFPKIDTLKSALDFLKKNSEYDNGIDSLKLAESTIESQKLEDELSQSSKLQQYFRERKMLSKGLVNDYPQLKSNYKDCDKVNYYYHNQIEEYKNKYADFSNVDQKAIELLKNNADFKNFISKNGQLSAFSKIPSDWGNNLKGLQTIKQTKSLVNKDVKELGAEAKDIVKKNMEPMNNTFDKLKSGNYGNTTNAADIPSFKPNAVKTKSFLDRVEFGNNFQINPGKNSFPSTLSILFQAGYKITDKIKPGIGVSYILGLGNGWNKTKFSNEGIGLSSFLDYKISNILIFECGYEKKGSNPASFTNEKGSKKMIWDDSALAGIKLKYNYKEKIIPTVSLLYNFLNNQHKTPSSAFIYRVGWDFGK